MTNSSSIDPQDAGLQPVVNPPCWASKTAVSFNLTIPVVKIVYLDQNHWIELARATYGRHSKTGVLVLILKPAGSAQQGRTYLEHTDGNVRAAC